ncbi:MAG: hypothetical protein Q9191_002568 [Dirinaria sp. TL-2023a]
MAMQTLNPPTGPRAGRKPSYNLFNRGGIQKRGQQSTRVDKDGDLDMDAASPNTGRGRGIDNRRKTSRVLSQEFSGRGHPSGSRVSSQGSMGRGHPSRDTRRVDPTSIQRAVLRTLGSQEPLRKGKRNFSATNRGADNNIASPAEAAIESLEHIIVYGLKESKAAFNPGGGVKDLLDFLERKATPSDAMSHEVVRIRKSRDQGDALIISVRSEDAPRITRLNGYQFAGATLKIAAMSIEPRKSPTSNANKTTSAEGVEVSELLKNVLDRRYDHDAKVLDLSNLGQDPQLVSIGMFGSTSTTSKFFPALMKVCDSVFATEQQKMEAVPSVSLAGNGLANLDSVTTLAQTFPNLKNLDLSNNQFKSIQSLDRWRMKFRKLEHVVLTGNPVVDNEPTLIAELMRWYPSLRRVGTTQVRSEEEAQAAMSPPVSIPTAPASFQDDMDIAKHFVTHFFPAFDTDRHALVRECYDKYSRFSMSVNNSALRDQSSAEPPMSWEHYLRNSRNLKKLKDPKKRADRLYQGQNSIQFAFDVMPPTVHPSIISEQEKWCIECRSLPGVPDDNTPGGVNGLMITVHGQYMEANNKPWNRHANALRSFDRTFVLGPGTGPAGIRVVSDLLVLRAYGGFEAFKPDAPAAESHTKRSRCQTHLLTPQELGLPEDFGQRMEGKTEEQVLKEKIAMELTQRTGMKLEYSGMCLDENGWNLEGAFGAFEAAKPNLPQDAFLQL